MSRKAGTHFKRWRNFSRSDVAKTRENREEARGLLSIGTGAGGAPAPGLVRAPRRGSRRGAVPGAPRGERVPFPALGRRCVLSLVPFRPDLAPILLRVSSRVAPERHLSPCQCRRVRLAARGAGGLMLPRSAFYFPPTLPSNLLFIFFLSFLLFCILCREEEKGARKGGWVEGEKIRFLITTIKKSNLQFFGRPDGSH